MAWTAVPEVCHEILSKLMIWEQSRPLRGKQDVAGGIQPARVLITRFMAAVTSSDAGRPTYSASAAAAILYALL